MIQVKWLTTIVYGEDTTKRDLVGTTMVKQSEAEGIITKLVDLFVKQRAGVLFLSGDNHLLGLRMREYDSLTVDQLRSLTPKVARDQVEKEVSGMDRCRK